MGKHIDKLPWDQPKGVGTLPVLLGERRARAITVGMMLGFYVLTVVLVAFRVLPLFTLLSLLAIPRFVEVWKAYSKPKPSEPPKGNPVWPLWYAPVAFVHSRRAGGLLLVGLVLAAIFHTV